MGRELLLRMIRAMCNPALQSDTNLFTLFFNRLFLLIFMEKLVAE